MSKSSDKRESIQSESLPVEQVKSALKPKYRYYCDGCTNTAFYSDKREAMKRIACEHCNIEQTTKVENYILNK